MSCLGASVLGKGAEQGRASGSSGSSNTESFKKYVYDGLLVLLNLRLFPNFSNFSPA